MLSPKINIGDITLLRFKYQNLQHPSDNNSLWCKDNPLLYTGIFTRRLKYIFLITMKSDARPSPRMNFIRPREDKLGMFLNLLSDGPGPRSPPSIPIPTSTYSPPSPGGPGGTGGTGGTGASPPSTGASPPGFAF